MLLAQQPNKHFATVEELGALTVFLASDAAASITGDRAAGRRRLDRTLRRERKKTGPRTNIIHAADIQGSVT